MKTQLALSQMEVKTWKRMVIKWAKTSGLTYKESGEMLIQGVLAHVELNLRKHIPQQRSK